MSLDLVEIPADILCRAEGVVQMSLLHVIAWQEVLVVLKSSNVVVGISVEQVAEHFGVCGGARGPHFPELIGKRIRDEGIPFVAGEPFVRSIIGRHGVDLVRGIQVLGGEKAKMFTPEHAAERGGVVTRFVGLAVHGAVNSIGVLHDNGQFRVVETELRLWHMNC